MIGVDWGTSSFRAFRLGPDGAVLERRADSRGLLSVADGRFADTLGEAVGDWIAAGEARVLLAGMVGSRQGWREAPYVPCPAGGAELAASVIAVPFEGASVRLVPGVSALDAAGVPEVMRGEETQIMGVLGAPGMDGLVCLPGSHSKWVEVRNGRIAGFATHLTGEGFAALRGHTILGRMMREGPADIDGFDRGLARAGEPGGLLHHLFGVRTLGLTGRLAETAAAAYLSGLLIGHELRAALGSDAGGLVVDLIGAPALCDLYARGIGALGGRVRRHDEDAAAQGLAAIGGMTQWD